MRSLYHHINIFRLKQRPILLKDIIAESGITWLVLRGEANVTQKLNI
jgi:hypothetical protein